MYLRFVRFGVQKENLWRMREFYEGRVVPALRETDGCLFASLLQALGETSECVSMTLWSTRESAEAYESSGLYDRLLDETDEAVVDATVWKADLSAGARPPLPDPVVETLPVELAGEGLNAEETAPSHPYLRIVEVFVEPSRFEAFKERYDRVIGPALRKVPGCRAFFLAGSFRGGTSALSVTLWDQEADAIRYERSGRFEELTGEVREFLSGLYDWRFSLAPAGRDQVEARDLDVRGFQVLAGRRLGS